MQCPKCSKKVFAFEGLTVMKQNYHKWCVRCSVCGHLVAEQYMLYKGQIMCKPHYDQAANPQKFVQPEDNGAPKKKYQPVGGMGFGFNAEILKKQQSMQAKKQNNHPNHNGMQIPAKQLPTPHHNGMQIPAKQLPSPHHHHGMQIPAKQLPTPPVQNQQAMIHHQQQQALLAEKQRSEEENKRQQEQMRQQQLAQQREQERLQELRRKEEERIKREKEAMEQKRKMQELQKRQEMERMKREAEELERMKREAEQQKQAEFQRQQELLQKQQMAKQQEMERQQELRRQQEERIKREQEALEQKKEMERQAALAKQKQMEEQKRLQQQAYEEEQKRIKEQQQKLAQQKALEQQQALEKQKAWEQQQLAQQQALEQQKLAQQQQMAQQKAWEQQQLTQQQALEQQKLAQQQQLAQQQGMMVQQPQQQNPTSKPIWFWEDADRKTWVRYDLTTNDILEKGFQDRMTTMQLEHSFFGKQGGYTVDFTNGTQKKNVTGFSRRIKRVEIAIKPKTLIWLDGEYDKRENLKLMSRWSREGHDVHGCRQLEQMHQILTHYGPSLPQQVKARTIKIIMAGGLGRDFLVKYGATFQGVFTEGTMIFCGAIDYHRTWVGQFNAQYNANVQVTNTINRVVEYVDQ